MAGKKIVGGEAEFGIVSQQVGLSGYSDDAALQPA